LFIIFVKQIIYLLNRNIYIPSKLLKELSNNSNYSHPLVKDTIKICIDPLGQHKLIREENTNKTGIYV
jgi:hypothetical protein